MLSDETLVLRLRDGEITAFEELVNRYKNKVFALVYRMVGDYQEAEDITQEVFLNIYTKINQFDSEKKFAPWLYRIATNTAISHLRKNKNRNHLNFDEVFSGLYSSLQASWDVVDPLLNMERVELKEEINKALSKLPENYRIIILLRYQLELNNQEIAQILNLKKENVEVKVHRARKALRKILEEQQTGKGVKHEL
ncbi:RNA polymerase sigma-70 factor, ECF subfamily [Thermosyntropha lipolytica DSM 11003]|uniref:RNA polymerase sigma factor n=1 Tax=Thermosyntropha lipolytica DSM 11003 TaxID=1123382 RepID=A0A1M5L7Z8_9FIRM|nr:sigma-70 family RNA polymerase sigma factor [Thermosyntropha lipolytica]SHG60523.1 RNA polymerase sigma-70 factor, ECF subfamily [Thermosyntropha lipolytica DSM 11003]